MPAVQSHTPQAVAFTDAANETLQDLYGRWQDEKEYEDIKEYAKPLQHHAEKAGVKIEKMTKRPFGCVFSCVCEGETRRFKFFCSARAIEWRRIA